MTTANEQIEITNIGANNMKTRTVCMMTKDLDSYIGYLGRSGCLLLGVRNIDHLMPGHVEVTFGWIG